MVITQKLKRWPRLGIAALLLFALVLPLLNARAGAYSLPANRYIKMSSSANGSTAAGQDVTYQVSFTPNQGGSPSNIGGLVLEFCSNTPILGDSCTLPTNFSLHAYTGDNTLAIANQVGITDWAIDVNGATQNRLVLSRTAASVDPTVTTTVAFDLGTAAAGDGVTNPHTTNTTFYARVVTFTTTAAAEAYVSNNIEAGGANTAVDAGGFALSTAAQITITAKVPEKLTFCVYTAVDTANTCSNPTGTAITLGDQNGVLSDTGPYVDKSAKYTVATNALYGVAIRMKGGTLKTNVGCPEAVTQTCSIDATGSPGATSNPNNEQFGMCTYTSDDTTPSTLSPAALYNGGGVGVCQGTSQTAGLSGGTGGDNGATFAFDNTAVSGTVSTYGQTIADKAAGTYTTGVLVFLGNITTTTEPGIYTTTLTFIATGTY